jgi:hypothetical protein
MTRKETLTLAEKAVCGDRQQSYGSPEDNFKMIANLWGLYTGHSFDARDVAVMMILLKIARISTGTNKNDNWVDIAGYAACGAEVNADEEDEPCNQ